MHKLAQKAAILPVYYYPFYIHVILCLFLPHFPSPDLPAPRKKEESEVKSERLYQQSHSYVEMNQRLQKACSLLKAKCEELKQAGATLEQNIVEIKEKAL
uniref:Uncharacterized protein n=1 Tax=Terrapene triunguis TaxID=2587831 RepID=A0A674IC25_9SAUR